VSSEDPAVVRLPSPFLADERRKEIGTCAHDGSRLGNWM
jgi:hypothetical protein